MRDGPNRGPAVLHRFRHGGIATPFRIEVAYHGQCVGVVVLLWIASGGVTEKFWGFLPHAAPFLTRLTSDWPKNPVGLKETLGQYCE